MWSFIHIVSSTFPQEPDNFQKTQYSIFLTLLLIYFKHHFKDLFVYIIVEKSFQFLFGDIIS